MNKLCKKCNTSKFKDLFYKQKRRSDGLHPWCKNCCIDYSKKNIEAKRARLRAWRLRNPEQIKELDHKYKLKRADKIAKYNSKYHSERRKKDVTFRLAGNLRNRLRMAIKNESKKGKTFDYVGCSLLQLKAHLESKFQSGMCWDNYGQGWHVDHIKPLCSFDLSNEEQLKQAMHYSNLQPLWARDNLLKGGR